jgi:uncharacterized protein YpiB (UPF0302 family)
MKCLAFWTETLWLLSIIGFMFEFCFLKSKNFISSILNKRGIPFSVFFNFNLSKIGGLKRQKKKFLWSSFNRKYEFLSWFLLQHKPCVWKRWQGFCVVRTQTFVLDYLKNTLIDTNLCGIPAFCVENSDSNEIWCLLISERLVYAFFFHHFWTDWGLIPRSMGWQTWAMTIMLFSRQFWRRNISFIIWTNIFHNQRRNKHWWISLTLVMEVNATKLQYCAVLECDYSLTAWNSSFWAVFWKKSRNLVTKEWNTSDRDEYWRYREKKEWKLVDFG